MAENKNVLFSKFNFTKTTKTIEDSVENFNNTKNEDNNSHSQLSEPDMPQDEVLLNNKLQNDSPYDTIPPNCWDSKQVKYFLEQYSWLYIHNRMLGCEICKKGNQGLVKVQGMHVSNEWSTGQVAPSGDDINKQQVSLRKKIAKHKSTQVHLQISRVLEKRKLQIMPNHILNLSNADYKNTEKIFRTAYFIAKNHKPYTDMPKLVDLHVNNGLEMSRILQTDKSCSNIIDHISSEMRLKLCNDIVSNKRKLCVIVDESTTLSNIIMLVICLRAAIANDEDIITFFFDIVELKNTTADTILSAIISNLSLYGMNLKYLKSNLVGFVSDGASNMLGRISGVGVKLQKIFPNIILWHCCNHRLELAVSDTLKEVHGTNHFQSFIEKLYALYHQSPKNRNELIICAASLEQKLLNIGKIFTIRWVASSERTLKAVWNNYAALHEHFYEASNDNQRESKERAKYTGLKKILASVEFVNNLGVMCDGLSELADLSLQLQNRNLSLSNANSCIERTVRVFDSMSVNYGPRTEEVFEACSQLIFKDVVLKTNHSVPKIKPEQFFKSLANNMRSRLFTFQASHSATAGNTFKDLYNELIKDLDILDVHHWPDNCDIQFGDKSVRRLAARFQVDEKDSVMGFREFKDCKSLSTTNSLKPLTVAINTIAISSSECERTFSAMNNIVTWKRNALGPKHMSSLLFINCVGPPVNSFSPIEYVKSWVVKGNRSAEETSCPKRAKLEDKKVHPYNNLWNYLNI